MRYAAIVALAALPLFAQEAPQQQPSTSQFGEKLDVNLVLLDTMMVSRRTRFTSSFSPNWDVDGCCCGASCAKSGSAASATIAAYLMKNATVATATRFLERILLLPDVCAARQQSCYSFAFRPRVSRRRRSISSSTPRACAGLARARRLRRVSGSIRHYRRAVVRDWASTGSCPIACP